MDQQVEDFRTYDEFERKYLPDYYQRKKNSIEVTHPKEISRSMMIHIGRCIPPSFLPDVPILSSSILNDWVSPEEDEAWAHL